MNKKILNCMLIIMVIIAISAFSMIDMYSNQEIDTSSSISNKKIEWGIKRKDNHEQPDVGYENKKVLEENKGICLGNSENKTIYLTFDEGYEAGYTEQILHILKENDVTATFFLTAHYINTQEDLVKQMIDEGHVVGNHTPKALMFGNNKYSYLYSRDFI